MFIVIKVVLLIGLKPNVLLFSEKSRVELAAFTSQITVKQTPGKDFINAGLELSSWSESSAQVHHGND